MHLPSANCGVMLKIKDIYLRPYIIDILISLVITALIVLSFIASVEAWAYENHNNWFERCGSIVVILAVYIEYRYLNIHKESDVHKAFMSGAMDNETNENRHKVAKLLVKYVGIFFMTIGTIIWGFGGVLITLYKA